MVIGRRKLRIKQLYLFHRALMAVIVYFDIIIHPERFQQQNQHPAGKVGQASLYRQTDRHTGRTKKRHHTGGIQSETGSDHEQKQDIQHSLDKRIQKLRNTDIRIAPL